MAATKKAVAKTAKPKFVSVALQTSGTGRSVIVALREDGAVYLQRYGRNTFERIANLSEIED